MIEEGIEYRFLNIVFRFMKANFRRKKEMKKKFVVALVAAMSLTVAGTGTVFAMDKVSTIASEKEHVHGDNCEWVVDKEAWTEEVVHPAETKQEWVVDKEAWTENILKYKCVCNGCHEEFASDEEWAAHDKAAAMNGDFSHGSYTNVPYYETVEHPEEGHWVCNGEPQEPEQKPEQPENPDVETPETPDAENPATPEQKPEAPTTPEANKENVQTQETETKKEGTSPKTGDTSSALPVAGAGLASLGVALATILKKRK